MDRPAPPDYRPSGQIFQNICATLNDYSFFVYGGMGGRMPGMSCQCQMLLALLVRYLDLRQYYHPGDEVFEEGCYMDEIPSRRAGEADDKLSKLIIKFAEAFVSAPARARTRSASNTCHAHV